LNGHGNATPEGNQDFKASYRAFVVYFRQRGPPSRLYRFMYGNIDFSWRFVRIPYTYWKKLKHTKS
jgi:hypothetical protein